MRLQYADSHACVMIHVDGITSIWQVTPCWWSLSSVDEDIVNMAAEDGATPLLIAAQEGYADIVDMLLDHGADANIQVTDTKAGPLQYAVYCGHSKWGFESSSVSTRAPHLVPVCILHALGGRKERMNWNF